MCIMMSFAGCCRSRAKLLLAIDESLWMCYPVWCVALVTDWSANSRFLNGWRMSLCCSSSSTLSHRWICRMKWPGLLSHHCHIYYIYFIVYQSTVFPFNALTLLIDNRKPVQVGGLANMRHTEMRHQCFMFTVYECKWFRLAVFYACASAIVSAVSNIVLYSDCFWIHLDWCVADDMLFTYTSFMATYQMYQG